MTIHHDYNDFAKQYLPFLNNHTEGLELTVEIRSFEECPAIDCNNTPFATNPVIKVGGANIIAHNNQIINDCSLSLSEQHACLLHEIGHLINAGRAVGDDLEILCDHIAQEANMTVFLISALYKIQEKLDINLQTRIDTLYSKLHLFRPEWACGRYNEEKQACILYNLIAGFSYFFDGYSA